MPEISTWRRKTGGLLVLIMLVATILSGLSALRIAGPLLWLAGFAGWGAGILLLMDSSNLLRIQVGVLLILGVILILAAASQGVDIDYAAALQGNIPLLTMVSAVGFLRLVAVSSGESISNLPVGRRAYFDTLMSTSVLGSVINLSAPILIADRLAAERPLNRFTTQSLTRVFSACASWSPFFAGMAVVLTYVPGDRVFWLMVAGLPFAVIGFMVVYAEASLRYPTQVEEFRGYPMKRASLWLPGVLALSVIVLNLLMPSVSILVIIALSALLVTTTGLLVRDGLDAGRSALNLHISNRLPQVVNELVLFLAAGVLATGISAIIQTDGWYIPVTGFGVGSAIVLLGLMVVVAAAGIHPIILISGFTPLVLALDPDPGLLAMTYLFAWSLGTCASPLSGTHLVFQGRYGIPSWKGAMWNWPYVIVMYGFSSIWLWVLFG